MCTASNSLKAVRLNLKPSWTLSPKLPSPKLHTCACWIQLNPKPRMMPKMRRYSASASAKAACEAHQRARSGNDRRLRNWGSFFGTQGVILGLLGLIWLACLTELLGCLGSVFSSEIAEGLAKRAAADQNS